MEKSETTEKAAADLLVYYSDLGVDEALESAPVDRVALAKKKKQISVTPAPVQDHAVSVSRETPTPPPARPNVAIQASGDAAIATARELAAAANSLDELHAALAGFEGCGLRRTAKNLCFADGNPDASLMLVGEAPGRDEDIQGLPFVGRAGQLLDKMLAGIGLDRERAYIANSVYWRPPGNRTPTPAEAAVCRPFIERQIELADPDVLMLLGGAAAKSLLETSQGIMRLRGRWRTFKVGDKEFRTLATLHPAYLLRQPAQKRLAWRDLLEVKSALAEKLAEETD
jgi:uracil-DNA glycosylase